MHCWGRGQGEIRLSTLMDVPTAPASDLVASPEGDDRAGSRHRRIEPHRGSEERPLSVLFSPEHRVDHRTHTTPCNRHLRISDRVVAIVPAASSAAAAARACAWPPPAYSTTTLTAFGPQLKRTHCELPRERFWKRYGGWTIAELGTSTRKTERLLADDRVGIDPDDLATDAAVDVDLTADRHFARGRGNRSWKRSDRAIDTDGGALIAVTVQRDIGRTARAVESAVQPGYVPDSPYFPYVTAPTRESRSAEGPRRRCRWAKAKSMGFSPLARR